MPQPWVKSRRRPPSRPRIRRGTALSAIRLPAPRWELLPRGQGPEHQIAVLHDAAFVVLLQCAVAFGVRVLLIHVIRRHLAVYLDDDVVALGDNVLRAPHVVRDELLENLVKAVQAAGLDRVTVAGIYLRLVAFGEAGAESRPEIHAGVTAVIDLHFGFKFTVFALPHHPEQVAGLPVAGDAAVPHGPGFGMLVGLPAIERLAVEHADPAVGAGRQAADGQPDAGRQTREDSHDLRHQGVRAGLDLANGFGDLLHALPRVQQHGLREPHGFPAQLVVDRALVAFFPGIQRGLGIERLVYPGLHGVLQERLLVQRRVAARTRNALSLERLQEPVPRQPVEVLAAVAEHVEVVGAASAAVVPARRLDARNLLQQAGQVR